MIPIYLLSILLLGLFTVSKKNESDFIYASRKLTLPSFIATFVTTWYGGILEIGRFSFENGVVTWVIFGLFYYLSAFIFVKYIGKKIHDNKIDTIPGYFHKHYGYICGVTSSIIIILISSPAPYLMIFAIILTHQYDISYIYSLLIGIFFSVSYILIGGFKSIIRTDKLQFVLMYSGFFIFFCVLYFNYGGISFLIQNTPSGHLSLTNNLPIGFILSWSLISMITFIDPNIFQRVYSADSKRIVHKGILISILFWIIFDFLSISIGLYASAIIIPGTIDGNPYLILSKMVLSPFFNIIFIISLFSIVMSSIDSFTFTSAITIAKEFKNKKPLIHNVKIGLIITIIVSLIISVSFKQIIDIWYVFGSIGASSILIPFIRILFYPNKKVLYPIVSIVSPIIICIIWILCDYPHGIDCMYPGIFTSLVLNRCNH